MTGEQPIYHWPIPDHRHRVVDFVGKTFLLDAAGVPAYQFARGLRGGASGGRLAAGAQAVRANTPRVVGSFAAFSAVYCATECAVSSARGGKDDGWNCIAGGAVATFLKHSRRGAFVAARAGLIGGSTAVAMLAVLHTLFERADRHTSACHPDRVESVATPQLQAASRSSGHIFRRIPLLSSLNQCARTS